MPRYQVHASSADQLAQTLVKGAQVTVDIGDGEVANATVTEIERQDDGATTLTYEAPREAVAFFVEDERVELKG